MLADREGQVRVRANFPGGVELLVRPGDTVYRGQGLVIVEGDREVERLSARKRAVVVEVKVKEGEEVAEGALLLVLRELPDEEGEGG
jgi:biotin carboxyl carrier protein